MADGKSISADAHELWSISNDEALALVNEKLGPPETWAASALLEYRLSGDFQADWKAEIGHWLHAAQRFGFLDQMLRPVFGERDRKTTTTARDLHDPRHLKLHQHLAVAMVCHYLAALNWAFAGWETETGGDIDIDLALNAPDGTLVEFQVKAPDRPAKSLKSRDGDFDHRVVSALENAEQQLPRPGRSVAMVGVFAQRRESLAGNPRCLLQLLYGRCAPSGGELVLPREAFGHFMCGAWNHVAGVALFDLLRGMETARYPSTVLLNPNADRPADPEWFPRSRVLTLSNERLDWIRGEPWIRIHGLPSGTRVVTT